MLFQSFKIVISEIWLFAVMTFIIINLEGTDYFDMPHKIKQLKKILKDMGSALIAFSGGVDSTFLLFVAREVLGDKLLAVTAVSPIYPSFEIKEAVKIAGDSGVKHITLNPDILSNKKIMANPPDRCYWCKKEIFSFLVKMAGENKIKYIIDGTNYDDKNDYRPGAKAVKELGIRSPLKEAGLTKKEIRQYSKKLGLQTWDKPSLACLASRIPYGSEITEDKLMMIDSAEEFLRGLKFRNVRVRHHGDIARIEVPDNELDILLAGQMRGKIIKHFKKLGYKYVTADIEGYRTGSMNEVLKKKTHK
jgi:uncharacterized protein